MRASPKNWRMVSPTMSDICTSLGSSPLSACSNSRATLAPSASLAAARPSSDMHTLPSMSMLKTYTPSPKSAPRSTYREESGGHSTSCPTFARCSCPARARRAGTATPPWRKNRRAFWRLVCGTTFSEQRICHALRVMYIFAPPNFLNSPSL